MVTKGETRRGERDKLGDVLGALSTELTVPRDLEKSQKPFQRGGSF